MKIHELPYGARFLYQGEEYVKTGPMIGSGKNGQRMIPRYVVLDVLDAPAAAPKKAERLARADVLRAFETFYAECKTLVAENHGAALAEARNKFLNALD